MTLHLLIRTALRQLEPIVPLDRREWLQAMAAEANYMDARERAGWLGGLLGTALMLALREGAAPRIVGLCGASLGLIWWDWHTLNSARVVALLLISAALLSAWHPRHFLQHGLVLGTCLLAAHSASEITGLARPFYCWKPLTWFDWLTILAIAPSALAAGAIGAWSRLNPSKG